MGDRENRIFITRTHTVSVGDDSVTHSASIDIEVECGADRTEVIMNALELLRIHLTENSPGITAPPTETKMDLMWKEAK